MTHPSAVKLPERLHLAQLPTPIQKLDRLSNELGVNLYIKRDDFTGTEVSGNKVRKLEFAAAEALAQGAKTLITCGAVQSNHARATAAVARQLGLDVHLVLRSDENPPLEGNYLLCTLLGAEIHLLSPETFGETFEQVMADIKADCDEKGRPGYILPIGASNAIGNFGYCQAYQEILEQEAELGLNFDRLVCAVGSGGTYGGLFLGNLLSGGSKSILGFSISSEAAYFQNEIARIVNGSLNRLGLQESVLPGDIQINDLYAGRGYALSTPEEMAFIQAIARADGLLLDPVYTGKAFRGLLSEIKIQRQSGQLQASDNILFIHTGGLMGFVPHFLTDPIL